MTRAFKHTRNRDYATWSTENLQNEIRHYHDMEQTVNASKARRAWKRGKEEMEAELARRLDTESDTEEA